jgi:hypothetical protein
VVCWSGKFQFTFVSGRQSMAEPCSRQSLKSCRRDKLLKEMNPIWILLDNAENIGGVNRCHRVAPRID